MFFFFFFYTCSVFPHCILCFWYSWSEYHVWAGRLDRVASDGVHHQGFRGPLSGGLVDEEPEWITMASTNYKFGMKIGVYWAEAMSSEEAPAKIVLKVKEPKRERVQPLDLLEILVHTIGGMKKKADGEESSPCTAMPTA